MAFDIDAQIDRWQELLLDTSKNNRLINFKVGGNRGIALAHPDPGDIWHRLVVANKSLTFAWKRDLIDLLPDSAEQGDEDAPQPEMAVVARSIVGQDHVLRCRNSPRLRPEHVLTDLPDGRLASRLTRLARNARESLAEQGVTILHIAFGVLRWFESDDSQVEVRSPLLLVPVRLERENIAAPWRLRVEDESVLPNDSLWQRLAGDFQVDQPELPDAGDDPNWRIQYFGAVQQRVRHQKRWEVLDEVALGTFSFQKLAMWRDLGGNRALIAASDICRAVAGDTDARVRLRPPSDLPQAADLDRVAPPASVYHVLTADSSQHQAIAAVTRGASLVLDGPPGTGKSQTIANIIAEFLAAGKTVLFVSEKAAALEVVHRRLRDQGLGDFCLACHSHKANKREVVAELDRCLKLPLEQFRDPTEELQRLEEARRELNEYVRELHKRREPLGMSFFEVQGELARLARLPSVSVCPVPSPLTRDQAYLRRVTGLLAGLTDCRGVIADRAGHPWRGCLATAYSPTLRDEVRHHLGRLAACLGGVMEVTAALHRLGFCEAAPNIIQWRRGVKTARDALSCPILPTAWFGTDPKAAAAAAVRVDVVSQAYRERLASLPEFAPEALGRTAPDGLASLTSALRDLGTIRTRPDDTLRSLGQRLTAREGWFAESRDRAEVAEKQAAVVAGQLRTPALCSSVKRLTDLEELAMLLDGLGQLRPSWWGAERRRELLAVFARCQEQLRATSVARAELLKRISLHAFAPENAGIIARTAGYRWFFARLLPAWWSFKARAAGWYGGQTPKAGELLDDMATITAYHRAVEECRQAQEHYTDDILVNENGKPDWAETLAGLRSVDRLEELVPTIFAALRGPLTGSGEGRQTLASAARELADRIADIRQRLESAAQGSELVDQRLGDLVARLQERADTTARMAALVGRLTTLLADGKDLPIANLPARVSSLADLGRLRVELVAHWGRAFPGRAVRHHAGGEDWSTLRQNAESFLLLLEAYRGELPAHVVKALTAQPVRGQLAEAVQNNDAVCAVGFEESWRFLAGLFDLNQPVSTGITLAAAPLSELHRWLAERAEDSNRLQEWVRFREIELQAALEGITPVVGEVLCGQVSPEEAAGAFRARFLGLWLAVTCESVPALRRFTTDAHERLIERFKELDRRAVESAPARIRAFQLSRRDRPRAVADEAPESSEVGILQREANKSRRHRALRELFAAIPNVLRGLKPCVMMSPLAVSTYLASPDIYFDLVIFDEASQVRPHDAIAAISRGRQLVVSGDQKQLPPTSFFDRVLTDEASTEEDGGIEDYDSILDQCCTLGLPRRRLRWHYRSRREGLIAFSNQFVYDNELVTFPSPDDVAGNAAVAFEHVREGRWKAGRGAGFNVIEARRTAELVLDHFQRRPDESLGVVAFSQKQQECILDALEHLRKDRPDLEEFFQEDCDEPFFVKNLENVQGDERDAILLGVGYGPSEATGTVSMNFGPLNKKNGERRLNVAVTRARWRVTVVSSMRAGDIDLSRTNAHGPELLRAYLDYAERGSGALRGAITGIGSHGFDSPFEQEVYEELGRAGMTVYPQVGCGNFRIDLAVADPAARGRYLLGVECDGATYHRSATARDRDRLRQEVLEGLGWRICRIWSTDWWRDRARQVRRVQTALEKATSEDREKPPPPPRTPPPQADEPANKGPIPDKPPEAELPCYKDIDAVPDGLLRETLRCLLRAYGSTQEDDLIKSVARKLGFGRTGRRIQARIEQVLAALIEAGEVSRLADGRMQLAPKTAQV
jgi:very-short-patch-repair endonuclease